MPDIHLLEPHFLRLLPPGWPIPRGHRHSPARMFGDEAGYRAWLTPLAEQGHPETRMRSTVPAPKRGLRWFAPGIPYIHCGEEADAGQLWQVYRLPVIAALEAANLGLIQYVARRPLA